MSLRLIRVALLTYPGRWRRRYGDELAALTLEVLDEPQSVRRRLRIIADLALRGLGERLRATESTARKATLTSTTAVVAAMFALVGAVASDSVPVRYATLPASARLGAGVSVKHTKSDAMTPAPPGHVLILVPTRTSRQISITGHSRVVINPYTDQVLSITRAKPHAPRTQH